MDGVKPMEEKFRCDWCNQFYDMDELGGKDEDNGRDVCVHCAEEATTWTTQR
jgi:hypothetical protein